MAPKDSEDLIHQLVTVFVLKKKNELMKMWDLHTASGASGNSRFARTKIVQRVKGCGFSEQM